MSVLRPVRRRTQKLPVTITEELEHRLRSVQSRCQEQGMELPLEQAVDDFLTRLLDGAEKELAGVPPRSPARQDARRRGLIAAPPAAASTPSANGEGRPPPDRDPTI